LLTIVILLSIAVYQFEMREKWFIATSLCRTQLWPCGSLTIQFIHQWMLSIFRRRWTPLTNKLWLVLYDEFVGFDLIPAGVRLK
jgi:hypothetical protein